MTREEWSKLVLGIKDLYPSEKVLNTEHAITLWYGMLKDLDYMDLVKALQKYASENRFPPTVADLRGQCATIVNGEIKPWDEEWDNVLAVIHEYGWPRKEIALSKLSELARTVVCRMGYNYLCASENIMADRAHFRDIYNNMVNKQKEREKLSAPLRNVLDKATERRYSLEGRKPLVISDKKPQVVNKGEEVELSKDVQDKLDALRRRLRVE